MHRGRSVPCIHLAIGRQSKQAYSVFDIATRRARVVVADVPVGANVDDYMGVWIDFWNSAFSYRDLCIACGIVSALRPCTHSGRHLWANRTTHSNTVCTCRQRHPVTSLHTLVLDAATLSQAVDREAITDPAVKAVLFGADGDAVSSNVQLRALWTDPTAQRSICFRKIVFSAESGNMSPWAFPNTEAVCNHSSVMLGMRDLLLDTSGLVDTVPLSHRVPTREERVLQVTYVLRGTSKTASATHIRDIYSPEALVAGLRTVEGVRVGVYDFGEMTIAQQGRVVRETDILVAVHGAALTWSFFLPSTAAVVEIVLGTYCTCYSNVATWCGLLYLGIEFGEDGYKETFSPRYSEVTDAVKSTVDSIHSRIEAL
eukprot:m.457981 g.457981  ORF g.457981 m.457981 type:complete len:371 (+) comp21579_c0_seq54:1659-2771(+)